MLATHALAGQPLNATTAVNYTRCVFQFVYGKTCAHKGQRNNKFFKDGPTASQAEAFALCDADPECDAVQEYGDKALINDNRTAWAEPCGADTCYMKCHDLGKDGCGRPMLEEANKEGRQIEEDAGGSRSDYESPAQHVYTCRPYEEEPGIRSPVAFSLFLIATILGGPLVYFVDVKLSRRYNCKKDGKCGLLEWSRFSCFFGAIWLIIGFGLLAGYFGPQDTDCEGDVLLYLGISFTSFAGFLLVVALWMAQVWWRSHRKQDMKVTPQRRQSRAVSAFSAAAIAPAPVSCRPGWTAHQNIGTPKGQGDVEIIHNWRKKHSLDELMRKVEQNGYSAISVGKFHQAVLKKFPYQLTADHCKPVQGYTNTFYIWGGGGSGKAAPAVEETVSREVKGAGGWRSAVEETVSREVIEFRLSDMEFMQACQFYLSLQLDDNKKRLRTKVSEETKHPVFEEAFCTTDFEEDFAIIGADSIERTLTLDVFVVLTKHDSTSAHELLGSVTVPLPRFEPSDTPQSETRALSFTRLEKNSNTQIDVGRFKLEMVEVRKTPKPRTPALSMQSEEMSEINAVTPEKVSDVVRLVVHARSATLGDAVDAELGTVVGEPAREPPPLHDIVDALKKNLGLDGTWPEVVDAACLQLGVAPTGSLQEKADECWRAMEG